MAKAKSKKSPRNKTLEVNAEEYASLSKKLIKANDIKKTTTFENRTINANILEVIEHVPDNFFDLIILDPPYNLSKNYNGLKFKELKDNDYYQYLESWFPMVVNKLNETGSIYLCGDWRNTAILQKVMSDYMYIQNRITWQREKGRGAKSNWKNSMEDIWFGTKSKKNYYFDVDSVKMKRKVIAPYRNNGKPKDWYETDDGNFRITHPSNFWDDISIPYWSMPENTEHPTQKPEKLIAKLILASCPLNGIVFDPFLGSGTTSVVAKKLGRRYLGCEINEEYSVWAEKRLERATSEVSIQGYTDGVFWERNTLAFQKKKKKVKTK